MYVKRKDMLPSIVKAIDAREYEILIAESVTLSGNYWQGGVKYYYRAINLDSGQWVESGAEFGNPFTCPHEPTIKLLPGIAVIRYRNRPGRDCTVFLHPDNANKLITTDSSKQLSDNEKLVLQNTKGLKSSYGGISNYRFHCANRDKGITLDAWNVAKDSLIARGLLDKRGALTTDGRNAANGL
jgi:hypothetical protein